MLIGTNEGEHSFLIELLFQESTLVRLLTTLMGHFDSLLEDWYPKLGNRFVQNAKDDYLINLFIPCHRCLTEFNSTEKPLCQTFWLEMLMMLIEKQQEIKWEILALIRTGKLLCLLYKSWDSNMLE
ncbi:unnamed protein product [Rotaria sp. Silwood1]|nr:unnamed protein product [Rotaria sp. Silwood1]CAF1649455.1 unnamed protein product [Rotaria sp. Silwood1]